MKSQSELKNALLNEMLIFIDLKEMLEKNKHMSK